MTSPSDERLLLVLVGDDRAGAELPRQGVLTVGSSKERAGFHVEGQGIDGVHCAIARAKGGGFALKDLGSAGGTRLNGARVEVARLTAGDRIQIGERELTVVDPAGKRAPDRSHETKVFTADAPGEVELTSTSFAAAQEAAAPLPTLTGYKIERRLGRGGMGLVYLAVQTSLDRPVALKILAPKLSADREFVRRFQAEARAAAALAHPNVVTVYDVGEEGGLHFLSMEYMDRGTLEERVAAEGRLSWAETLDVLRDAAAGLVYAESKRIVHRDLKPANLMRNHVGATKIADLGLATHIEAEEGRSAEKKVFGTPHFMSPEQARGERVDGRSDLYSLGATAYRLLTGHTPFEGTNAREIVRAHLTLEPRPMREFAPDLPEEALSLVAKLMQKDPAQRFASAAELNREVERLRARGPGAPTAPVPRGKRSRLVPALLVLVLLGAGGWWLAREKPWEKPSEAAVPRAVSTTPPRTVEVDPALVAPPEDPVAPPADPQVPGDDDKALQLLEANARVALLELLGQEMRPNEKRDALRQFAVAWRGTSAATEAFEKADQIQLDLETRAAADVERQGRIDELVARMETAAALDTMPPRPGAALLNMRAVPGQEAVAGDPAFQEKKRELERQLIGRAAAYARARLEESELRMSTGDFEAVERELAELMPVLELPDFPPGEGPGGVAELYEIGRTARERLKNLELLRGQFVDRRLKDDRMAIARGFGGPAGLERELRSLDLASAKTRLAALEAGVGSPEAKAFVQGLRADVESGEKAFAALGREFAAWRRKTFTVPQGGKSVSRNAVGADAAGILAEKEGGAVEQVPWSTFGGDGRELSKLFVERLTREWTADETRGIAALVRLTAVVEAVSRASKMFDAARRFNFTEADEHEMAQCFDPARSWGERAGTTALIQREKEAAALLAVACRKMTDKAWATAAVTVEDLLSRYSDTLVVWLLSDGTAF
ncbi:MAG: protein kinase domain-containing protein [Planctomycetota bacterium]